MDKEKEAKLRALVSTWRMDAKNIEDMVERGHEPEKLENRNVFLKCARELEAILDEEDS